MPSVTQNRMRLARMTGSQAVAAVRAPAPHLMGEAVAEAVVRFVAGGAELERAEVEPSLLSLICRELNNTRLAQGHAEISADLLAGSRDTILSEFYERALADQPHGVREFVEDEMLTDSGFRESIAEERVRKGFVAAGASPEALATLVNRRLLRVEDRLDLRRVEITHDVLCSVIAASRAVRREREALEESRRQLALQREREAATQRSLLRARTIAAVCAVLMLAAGGSAVFGWMNLRRAREAEAQTQKARELTEKARSEAEKLVGFLLEDFYEELLPTGRVEIVGNLADKAVAYYDGLPPELITKQTELYRGMALVRKSGALAAGEHVMEAEKTANQAREIFESLRAGGDTGEATSLGLALSLFARSTAGFSRRDVKDFQAAAALLRPFVDSGKASRSSRLAMGDILQYGALEGYDPDASIVACDESRRVLESLGALDLTDLTASSIYADVCDTESRLFLAEGKYDDAERLAVTDGAIAEKVLAKRPGDLRAMKDHFQSPDVLGRVAQAREHYVEAEAFHRKSLEAARNYAAFNPSDTDGWLSCSISSNQIATVLMDQGRISDAIDQWHRTTELDKDPRNATGSGGNIYYAWRFIARFESQRGNTEAAAKALEALHQTAEQFKKTQGTDEAFNEASAVWEDLYRFDILASKGDYETIHAKSVALNDRLQKIVPKNALTRNIRTEAIRQDHTWIVESALRTSRPEEAMSLARQLAEPVAPQPSDEKIILDMNLGRARVRLGQSLIASGKKADARTVLEKALSYYRSRQANGASATLYRQDFGAALYHLSQAQEDDEAGRAQRRALLDEAASVLGGLSQEAQQFYSSRELIQWVIDARSRP